MSVQSYFCARAALLIAILIGTLAGQPARLSTPIQKTQLFRLSGSTPAKARIARDQGAAPANLRMDDITIHFKPSTAQQSALEKLLRDQQDPTSPDYRRWLTPEEYANRFGLNAEDLQRISEWLTSEGLSVNLHARGRSYITFRGTAAQLRSAFQTDIHHYQLNGKLHYANTTAPALPAALQDIVSSIEGLDDFLPEPGAIEFTEANTASGGHTLAPNDIAAIYGIRPLYDAGIDGSGQKMVIVGQSAIDLDDIRTYRTKYNLPANDPQVILYPTSADPGTNSALAEGNLDLDVAGAVARNATIIYVYGRSAFSALTYAVDQNLAPVISASYSFGCEAVLGSSSAASWRTIAMRANAQGITWINSSGDAGAAACDSNSSLIAQNGLSVRFPASIPEVTGVGGTQFSDATGNWWSSANDANGASALSYIPEAAWNGSIPYVNLQAGGGGKSAFYPKPVWQTGSGVPDDGARDVPDIAFASAGHTPYNVISGGKASAYFGTSGAAPAFAGMVALLNQMLVNNKAIATPGLGNINPTLYRLAQINPAIFHDVTAGSNAVPCAAASPDCVGGLFGYYTTSGYDLATGLGSIDLFALANSWPTQAPTDSIISFGINTNPVYQLAQPTSAGNNWVFTLTIAEQAGVPTRLTDLVIDGASYASQLAAFFGKVDIPAHGYISGSIGTKSLSTPFTRNFVISGIDPGTGRTWKQTLTAQFLGFAPAPVIGGVAHGASFTQAFAPGMVLSVFGSNLTTTSLQSAAIVPLTTYMGNLTATVNGISTPFYFVSPGQVNLQIPYETAAGTARLILNNGIAASNTFTFQVANSAPGIFVGGDGAAVPHGQGRRGGTYLMFITGEGLVTPNIATGASPANLPSPRLPYSVTVGGVPAKTSFFGIPPGLVGVTQVNFVVPDTAPLGQQQIVVTVGNASSEPAKFTVTQ